MKINQQITDWINDVIIGLNLCPFASAVYHDKSLKINLSNATDELSAQKFFLDCLEETFESIQVKTTLVCYSSWDIDFEDFYDFVTEMNELLKEINLDLTYQLIAFHPNFQLAEIPLTSFAHWPNSSPVPMIHILSFEDIRKVANESQGFNISLNNEKTIKNLSSEQRRKLWPWKS
jgi:uncharacterized protein